MKEIQLLESCGYGSTGSVVTINEHTADYLIRTGRANEVRGTIEGANGIAVENIGDAQEHLNAGDTTDGGNSD